MFMSMFVSMLMIMVMLVRVIMWRHECFLEHLRARSEDQSIDDKEEQNEQATSATECVKRLSRRREVEEACFKTPTSVGDRVWRSVSAVFVGQSGEGK